MENGKPPCYGLHPGTLARANGKGCGRCSEILACILEPTPSGYARTPKGQLYPILFNVPGAHPSFSEIYACLENAPEGARFKRHLDAFASKHPEQLKDVLRLCAEGALGVAGGLARASRHLMRAKHGR